MTYICGILLYVLTFVNMSGLGPEVFCLNHLETCN